MKFRALRPLFGDFGPGGAPALVGSGGVFEVPDCFLRRFLPLERRGLIAREAPARQPGRRSYVIYQPAATAPPENAAIMPAENKNANNGHERKRNR